MKTAAVAFAVFLAFIPALRAQTVDPVAFGSKNTFSPFIEYSNDSSHIILGRSPDRKFAGLGIQYERRLRANRKLTLRYAAEFRPLILERDVAEIETFITPLVLGGSVSTAPSAVTQCIPETETIPITIQISCSHRWSYAQGLSPGGIRMNLLPQRRLQPTGSLLVGYMLSSKKIPVDNAGSFNFTFEIGAGFEYFLSSSRSMRFEYQIQHFSNAHTAPINPGVDNGLFKITYTFGR
jgi:opacity protein-like surface antigen